MSSRCPIRSLVLFLKYWFLVPQVPKEEEALRLRSWWPRSAFFASFAVGANVVSGLSVTSEFSVPSVLSIPLLPLFSVLFQSRR